MVLERGAGRQVHDEAGLAETVALYLELPALREASGEAGRALVAENRGAVERTLQLMSDSLRWARPELDTAKSVSALHD
jgi:3-deoxy-D-manno-octulosonic-acid transferase